MRQKRIKLEDFLSRKPAVVVITGDNGTGKTQFLMELQKKELVSRLVTAEPCRHFCVRRDTDPQDWEKTIRIGLELVRESFPEFSSDGGFEVQIPWWVMITADGLHRRVLTMAIFAATVKDGWLLIDDAETSVGVRMIDRFADFIFLLARRFSLRVVLTTHSKELCYALCKRRTCRRILLYAIFGFDQQRAGRVATFAGNTMHGLIDCGSVDPREGRVNNGELR